MVSMDIKMSYIYRTNKIPYGMRKERKMKMNNQKSSNTNFVNKMFAKRISALALVLMMAFALVVSTLNVEAASNSELNSVLSKVVEKTVVREGASKDPWLVIGVNQSGFAPEGLETFNNAYIESVDVEALKGATEYAKAVLALSSMGIDCTNFKGANLIEKMLNNKGELLSLNAYSMTYIILALDCNNYSVPASCDITRDEMVDVMLATPLDENGLMDPWGYGGDIDTTFMAIQALSNYRNNESVDAFIKKALTQIVGNMSDTGAIYSWGSDNCSTSAQVLVALIENRIDPSNYTKNGRTLVDGILQFANVNTGIFDENNTYGPEIPTEQGLYALAAVKRASEGKTLYNMTDKFDKRENASTDVKEQTSASGTVIKTSVAADAYTRVITAVNAAVYATTQAVKSEEILKATEALLGADVKSATSTVIAVIDIVGTPGQEFTLNVNDVKEGDNIILIHYGAKTEYVKAKAGNGTITATVDSFSPFAIVKVTDVVGPANQDANTQNANGPAQTINEKTSPKTSDSYIYMIMVGILLVSSASLTVAFRKNK